jgi:hypothetical protein
MVGYVHIAGQQASLSLYSLNFLRVIVRVRIRTRARLSGMTQAELSYDKVLCTATPWDKAIDKARVKTIDMTRDRTRDRTRQKARQKTKTRQRTRLFNLLYTEMGRFRPSCTAQAVDTQANTTRDSK